VFTSLASAAEKPAATYRLAPAGLSIAWGEGRAEVTLKEAPPFSVSWRAGLKDGILEIREAVVRSAGGSLTVHGTLDLAAPRCFQVAGTLAGFDPAAFGDYPPARVNASFSVSGRLSPQPRAEIRFAIGDSRFRRQPLSGRGVLSLSAGHIRDSDVVLRLARNTLEVKGSLGVPGDRLAFRLDAGNLAVIAPELAGRISATGTLAGDYAALSGAVELEAENLRWGKDYRVAGLRASGRLEQGLDGLLALDASAKDIVTPRIRLDQARVAARGSRTEHNLRLVAKNPDIDLEGRFVGGWRDEVGWSGQVLSLVNRGRYPLALRAPARLEAGPGRFLLAAARIDLAGAAVTVHETSCQAGRITSRGEFKGLPATYLQKITEQPVGVKTDLRLGGEWRIDAHDMINGRLRLWREQGDIILPTVPQTALALNRLVLDVEAVDNALRGRLAAAGTTLGSLGAEARSRLSRRDGAWGIAGDAPLQATADLDLQSVAWLVPLLDKTVALTLDGALKAQVRAGGSLARPRLAGTLSGEGFRLELPGQGIHFRDGRFLAELQDEAVLLRDLSLRGGEGKVTGQGRLALRAGVPDMQVTLIADRLEVLSRPDRHLILSGTGTISMAEKKVRISAKLKADRGVIELSGDDAPSPSEDVVVLGREEKAARKALPYTVQLELDLGERFFLRGQGLDVQLGGAVKLVSMDGALPRSAGSIYVVNGAYSAYGQRLEIDRGILNFQGPVDNPGLNIVALRKNQEVEAGVAITGTAQNPRVTLVSNPNVPASEKLSWLVLGHGVEGSSGQEFSVLQAAAGALLAAGDSVTLQQHIAHAAGLEEVSLKGGGTLESTVLTLGKRLSSRAYLSYEHSLSGADTLVKVNYTLTKRLSVRAQAGTTPALDLFYSFSFD
jgi:translocation and assembly module TamB